jgi:hypothetical protein
MISFDRIIFFAIAQGELYAKMAGNLFRSLKNKNINIKTACISDCEVKYCDFLFKISELCPLENNVNEAHINRQSYSFKLGIYEKLPKDFLKNFDKIIFYDCDSICINPIEIDESIYESIFYVPWCQSIVTQNKDISSRINLNYAWNDAYFSKHKIFADKYNIKEWKNVNAGLIVISINKLSELIDLYKEWVNKIYDFYGPDHGTEELTFSLMMANIDSKFNTPNICNNKIGQLCINQTLENVIDNNKFNYHPWFNSTKQKYYEVNPTCVHFPNQKLEIRDFKFN